MVRWRCADLQALIADRFGVTIYERTKSKLLRRLTFARISVRPQHTRRSSRPAAQLERPGGSARPYYVRRGTRSGQNHARGQ